MDRAAPLSDPGRSLSPREKVAAWFVVPTVLAALVLFQTSLFRRSTSETYDEPAYLTMGVQIYRAGDFREMARMSSPPLAVLLEYWWPGLHARSLPGSPGWPWEAPELIRQARLTTSIVIGVPLALAIYGWLAARRGWPIGALGGGLAALSPSLIAASSLATTDACFALVSLVAMAGILRFQARPSRGTFVLAGAGIGLALSAKQTGAIFFPVTLVELLWKLPARPAGRTRVDACFVAFWRVGSRLAALAAIAFTVNWASYGFGLCKPLATNSGHTTLPIVVPMIANLFPDGEALMDSLRAIRPPMALDTFLGQLDHASRGHPSFLMGRRSYAGWWYFFPAAIALKSTPAELLLFAIAGSLALLRRSWSDPTRRVWLTTLLSLLGAGIASSLNLGQRYMLPAYPLAILLAVDALGALRARRVALVAGALLLAWQGVSIFGIAPHYLGYFNSMSGGPLQGYRHLVDANLDWGQDLPALRKALEARHYRKVALSYFGTALPEAYGLRRAYYPSGSDPVEQGCDWLAISATKLQGPSWVGPPLQYYFRDVPSARVGYGFFLYDLEDPAVREAVAAERKGRAVEQQSPYMMTPRSPEGSPP